MRTTARIVIPPGEMTDATGMLPLARVADDHVERAAVAGDPRDRLRDLILRRQQERRGVEVLRPGRRRLLHALHARDDAPRSREHAVQEIDDDGEDDDQQGERPDPPENHRGLRSATTAALRAMPGRAPRMISNWALIAVTAPSSGRRCSSSTPSSAVASVASPMDTRASRCRTTISAPASTTITTIASATVSSARSVVPLMRHRTHR